MDREHRRGPAFLTGPRAVVLFAVLGTIIAVTLCLADLSSTRDQYGGLVAADPTRADAALMKLDFPDEAVPASGGHDGPFYYAQAREPMHLDQAAQWVDRPRYRFQRLMFPMLAWALHPSGGGDGLVAALFAVNVAGVLAGGVATGALSLRLGGPAWPAVVYGALYGSVVSLRITTPDALALALTVAALALAVGRSPSRRAVIGAVALAVAAVLTKEASLITFVGLALWRRDRLGYALVVVPAAFAGAWYLYLSWLLPSANPSSEFTVPFAGWVRAVRYWGENGDVLGMLSVALGLLAAGAVLARCRPGHPLWWPVVLNLVFTIPLTASVIGPERNASRVFLVLQVLGLVTILTRSRGAEPDGVQPA